MARASRRGSRAWGGFARGAVLAAALVAPVVAGAAEIVSARYDGPTSRYPHGALGDKIEHDTLVVRLSDGREIRARWGEEMVFEDTAPRLADLDGDGAPEVVVVETHVQRGARLAVWGLKGGALSHLAATPHIGTRFRWLAPVGAADLDGDGFTELAYVDRPHLAKVLRVWRYLPDGPKLVELASLPNLTNHRIGWDHIDGGIRDCGQGPEMVLADGGWQKVMAVRFDGRALRARELGRYSAGNLAAALSCH